MDKKNIYIIRHGETDYNKLGIVQGSGADIELNSRGLEQAQFFYNFYKNISFDVIFISALKRTYQTVKAFIDMGVAYKVIPELNEISWGILEGKMQTQQNKEIYWNVVNQWRSGKYDAKIENGESANELYNRLSIAANKIFNRNTNGNILVCMHGRAMKAFLCLLLNQPLSNMDYFEHSNTCVYQLITNDFKTFEIIKQNNIEHLTQNLV
ncbi:MAG: histidine phosphatase family protein [Bacteroidia bacterium]